MREPIIRTNIEHAFNIRRHSNDSIIGEVKIADGMMFPKSDWFSLSIGNEDHHIKVSDWEEIKQHVDALILKSKE